MSEKDAGSTYGKDDKDRLSLGVLALIGKALNDGNLLEALLNAKEDKERLRKTVREKACIDLTDCELDQLLKGLTGGLSLIDLIKIARECIKQQNPNLPPKYAD